MLAYELHVLTNNTKTLTYKTYKKNPDCQTEVVATFIGVNGHLGIDRISMGNKNLDGHIGNNY